MKTVRFQSMIVDSEKINKMFTKVKIRAAYEGLNRNNSFISRETFENAASTAKYCPIVGEWSNDIEDFKDHGGKIEIDEQGIKFINTTMPYGCIGDEEPYWETVELGDGSTRDYFTLTGYLWTERFPELESVVEDAKSHSMEVNVEDGQFQELDNQEVYVIKDMVFSGFCILGNDVEPCFEESSITAYSLDKDEFKKQFNQMVSELKYSLSGDLKMASKKSDKKKKINIDNSKDAANMTGAWGDVNKTDLRNKLTSASNAKSLVDEGYLIVDDNWKDAPSEALHYPHHQVKGDTLIVHKAGLEAAFSRLMANDPNNEKAIKHLKRHYRELDLDMSNFELKGGKKMEDKNKGKGEFSLSSEQIESELRRELGKSKSTDQWGYSYQDYYLVDYLPDEKIAVAYDCKENYMVGFNYSVDGDVVSVDVESKKRFKIQYEPMDAPLDSEGNNFSLVPKEYVDYQINVKEKESEQNIKKEYDKKIEKYEDDIAEANKKFEKLKQEKEELETFKTNKLTEERSIAEEELFSNFSNELTDEEMKDLKEKASEYSLEDLEEKLFSLAGRKKVKFNSNKSDARINMGLFDRKVEPNEKKSVWVEQKEKFNK